MKTTKYIRPGSRRPGAIRNAALAVAIVALPALWTAEAPAQVSPGGKESAQDAGERKKQGTRRSGRRTRLAVLDLGEGKTKAKRQTRAAREFRHLDRLDEQGKPVADDHEFVLPNGERKLAGAYYEELDRIEEALNAEGWSLTDDGDTFVVGGHHRKASRSKVRQRRLNRKYKRPAKDAIAAVTIESFQSTMTGRKKTQTARIEAIDTDLSQIGAGLTSSGNLVGVPVRWEENAIDYHKSWSDSLGSGDFSVDWGGSISLEGTGDALEGSAEGEAGATVFGKSVSLLNASADFESNNDTETGRIAMQVSVKGKSIYNFEKEGDNTWDKEDNKSAGFEVKVTVPVTLIPGVLTANIRAGARGDVGIEYGIALAPTEASAFIQPYTEIDAFVEASVSLLGIAEGGAGGELTLLNASMDISGEVGLDAGQTSMPSIGLPGSGPSQINTYLYYKASGYLDVTALDGRMYAFAEIWIPFKGTKRYEVERFEFDGYRLDRRQIFNVEDQIKLFSLTAG